MKKLILILAAVLVVGAVQAGDNFWHPQGFPPGLPGSYNNPVRVHANVGEQVTLGDFSLGLTDPWYVVSGWWNPRQTSTTITPYYDLFGHHRGQFLIKTAEVFDYNYNDQGIIYAVADPAHGNQFVFFRIIPRPPASGGVLEP